MNPFTDLRASLRGWAEILNGKRDAGRNFTPTRGGLLVAIGWFVVAVLLSVAAQSAAIGVPSVDSVLVGLLAQGLTLGALAAVIDQTLRFLRVGVAFRVLFVPIVYALAYAFVLATPLTLIGPNAGLIAIFGLGALIFRAGQILADMRLGVAIAFAILCVIVLVVVPNALYIVVVQLSSPA